MSLRRNKIKRRVNEAWNIVFQAFYIIGNELVILADITGKDYNGGKKNTGDYQGGR